MSDSKNTYIWLLLQLPLTWWTLGQSLHKGAGWSLYTPSRWQDHHCNRPEKVGSWIVLIVLSTQLTAGRPWGEEDSFDCMWAFHSRITDTPKRRTEGSLKGQQYVSVISAVQFRWVMPNIVPKADTAFRCLTFLFRCISWSCKWSLSSVVFWGWGFHLISRGCSSGLDVTFVNPLAYSTLNQGLYTSFHPIMFVVTLHPILHWGSNRSEATYK